VNKKELMGKHVNTRWFNWVAYATSVIVVGLTLVMMWQSFEQMRGIN
jgi:Mn2+/Fe2+ NRAMP family transporter